MAHRWTATLTLAAGLLLGTVVRGPRATGTGVGVDGNVPVPGAATATLAWQVPGGPACIVKAPWPAQNLIAPPDPALDPALASFLGVWEGNWGVFPSRLAFDMVDPVAAAGIYAYPEQGATAAGSSRFTGRISAHSVTWDTGGPAATSFTFTISDDGQTILAKRTAPSSAAAAATFTRCSDPSAGAAMPQADGAIVSTSGGFAALPASATAAEAGVVDAVGVAESQGAVQMQTLSAPVTGMLFEPAQRSGPLPAVLILHGSEGYDADSGPTGLQNTAKHYAAQGFVTLALCYFGCSGRPSVLERMPLEYVFSALDYLEGLPEVDGSNVSIWGLSRGAELALIVGADRQELRSVVALYGSPTVAGATTGNGTLIRDCAWTLNDQCLAGYGTLQVIPVERIKGPVLLLHGLDDALWPAAYSQRIEDELEAAGHPSQLTVLPGVGHGFGLLGCMIGPSSCHPRDDGTRVIGAANVPNYVNAARVAFAQTVAFLHGLQ